VIDNDGEIAVAGVAYGFLAVAGAHCIQITPCLVHCDLFGLYKSNTLC